MRRFIQLMALLVMVLAGSLPGLHLLGPSWPAPCCAHMAGQPCPCPSRAPGPTAPCGLGQTAPALLAAPALPAQAEARKAEPSPCPGFVLASAPRLEGDPAVLARPGPILRLPPLDRQALLAVFRI
ncbi:MAG: hypothetical protein ABSH53_01250 [Holophaga sp.]